MAKKCANALSKSPGQRTRRTSIRRKICAQLLAKIKNNAATIAKNSAISPVNARRRQGSVRESTTKIGGEIEDEETREVDLALEAAQVAVKIVEVVVIIEI